MVNFDKTPRTAIEEALTRGDSLPFDIETLERIKKQEEKFLRPQFNYSILLIPLVIIGYLWLKKY